MVHAESAKPERHMIVDITRCVQHFYPNLVRKTFGMNYVLERVARDKLYGHHL
ncbi:hypothetical protein IC575_001569 [Cucumis melo]